MFLDLWLVIDPRRRSSPCGLPHRKIAAAGVRLPTGALRRGRSGTGTAAAAKSGPYVELGRRRYRRQRAACTHRPRRTRGKTLELDVDARGAHGHEHADSAAARALRCMYGTPSRWSRSTEPGMRCTP